MTDQDLTSIHTTLIGFTKRAEKATDESLVATFVDSAPLFTLLSTTNNQVIYGRRGTGKTHALKVLAEHVEKESEIPVFLDMRTVGSNGSIYADASRPLAERASLLISDVLSGILNEFYGILLKIIEDHPNTDEVTRRLDAFQNAISTVKIEGEVLEESSETDKRETSSGLKSLLSLSNSPSASLGFDSTKTSMSSTSKTERRTGRETIYLSFGSVSNTLSNLIDIFGGQRVWMLIDEWSEVPIDLQPYLADIIRRVLLPINKVSVKIAAIEHRTNFTILKDRGEYIGLELGADVSADLNLDDFLVFDNNQSKSVEFIGTLIFRHYASTPGIKVRFASYNELISTLFTQKPAFEEFVRAVEGVPRDALNLIAKVVTKAFGVPIAMSHVRAGASDWYNQDKAAVIKNDESLSRLLQHIVSEVISNRRARAFLLSSSSRYLEIDRLFDARLLHILKKNISSRDDPGARFDAYKIDYGCYVDLINTTKSPMGLFEVEEGEYIEVPVDDYRSIRRAILDPTKLVATG
ncbi:MAG: hypothetical protein ACKOPR_07930 [Chakrabartia godavariana]